MRGTDLQSDSIGLSSANVVMRAFYPADNRAGEWRGIVMTELNDISKFYYEKFVEWNRKPEYRWFGEYIISNRDKLCREFDGDPKFTPVREFITSRTTGKNRDFYVKKIDYGKHGTNSEILRVLLLQSFSACSIDADSIENTNLWLLLSGSIGIAIIKLTTLIFWDGS